MPAPAAPSARTLVLINIAMLGATFLYAVVGAFVRPLTTQGGESYPLAGLGFPLDLLLLLLAVPSLLAGSIIPYLPMMKPRGFREGVAGLEPDPEPPADGRARDDAASFMTRILPLSILGLALIEQAAIVGLIILLLAPSAGLGYGLIVLGALGLAAALPRSLALAGQAADIQRHTVGAAGRD